MYKLVQHNRSNEQSNCRKNDYTEDTWTNLVEAEENTFDEVEK